MTNFSLLNEKNLIRHIAHARVFLPHSFLTYHHELQTSYLEKTAAMSSHVVVMSDGNAGNCSKCGRHHYH